MNQEREEIKIALVSACQVIAKEQGDSFMQEIQRIAIANLERGRVEGFIEQDLSRIKEYIDRLAGKYLALAPRIEAIQVKHSEEQWNPLLKQMQAWAYQFLVRKGFFADDNTRDVAAECATEASLALLNSHFPYDTDFEPWVNVIVQNTCRKYIRKSLEKKRIPDEMIKELDADAEEIADPNAQPMDQGNEVLDELLKAIPLLSASRRRAIELLYFDELPPAEVARIMGKSVGAIYNLQFSALNELRKILGKRGNNTNE